MLINYTAACGCGRLVLPFIYGGFDLSQNYIWISNRLPIQRCVCVCVCTAYKIPAALIQGWVCDLVPIRLDYSCACSSLCKCKMRRCVVAISIPPPLPIHYTKQELEGVYCFSPTLWSQHELFSISITHFKTCLTS